jgi:hypothetical protein
MLDTNNKKQQQPHQQQQKINEVSKKTSDHLT